MKYATLPYRINGKALLCHCLVDDDGSYVEPSTVRLTHLHQGHEHVFGDNSVTHYVMEYEPIRRVESSIPELTLNHHESWTVRNDRGKVTNYYDWEFTSGINEYTVRNTTALDFDESSKVDYVTATISQSKFEWGRNKQGKIQLTAYYERTATLRTYHTLEPAWPDIASVPWSKKGWNNSYGFREITSLVWSEVPHPYYWMDHMNTLFAEEVYDPTDVGALSECIRNTIQENTTYDTNGYQNMISFLQTINDIRKLDIGDLLKSSQNLWKTILEATGHTIDDDPVVAKRIARRALRKKAKGAAASAWLQYRYVYNTTKADYEQFVRAKVGEYLGSLDQNRVLRGSINIGGGQLRVKMRLHDNSAVNFDKFFISANQYGLFPGLYNLWDMIPFSFIADWFANLGNELQDLDQSIFFRYYKVDELLVTRRRSYAKEQPWGYTRYKIYTREFLPSMPQWEIYEDPSDPSGRTIFKRCLDGVSIVSGFL